MTVLNHSKGAAKAEVALQLPQGWRAEPASQPVAFSREDEAVTVRFTVTPAPPALGRGQAGGSHLTIGAVVRDGGGDLRPGLSGGRVPAHHAPPRAAGARGDRQRARRGA